MVVIGCLDKPGYIYLIRSFRPIYGLLLLSPTIKSRMINNWKR